jgi:hypothetical protein
MMPRYQDFFLIINGSAGHYTVECHGPGEIIVPPQPLVWNETPALRHELEQVETGEAPSPQWMQALGSLLHDAVFPPSVGLAMAAARQALPDGTSLRLKLVVRPPELNALPWELLYDPVGSYFLAGRLSFPVVRFVESGTPVASLLARRPLRILHVQSSPKDIPGFDLERSSQALRSALGRVKDGQPLGEITRLRTATPQALREHLRQPFHILHYDGHAYFDEQEGIGKLALVDESGNAHLLDGELLSTYLDGTSIRLVVLAACATGLDSRQQRFSGIAQRLMRSSSLPAVVAMQFAISDTAAAAFTTGFYGALADDYPVDAAVIEGRKSILDTLAGEPFSAPDWAAPVLFMRSPDGDIFREDLKAEEPTRPTTDQRSSATFQQGGISAGRDVRAGRDMIGRDKIVHGDDVGGDKVTGDQIRVGDIIGGQGIAIGRNAQVSHIGAGGPSTDPAAGQWAVIFQYLISAISRMPDLSSGDRSDLQAELEELRTVLQASSTPDEGLLARRLRAIHRIAPDAFEFILASLAIPGTAVGDSIRKLGEQIKGG